MSIIDDDFLELNQILDNTIEGILIIENGFIKNVNKSLMEILDYDKSDDLTGNLATGILLPNIREKFVKYNSKMFQEISLLNKNGNIIPAIIKIKDITINEKNYKMVSVLDLTEIKDREKLLLDQSKFAAMGELISMIAHQWRQPLASLASIIVRLKLKIQTGNTDLILFDKKLHQMNEQVQYMSRTIDDFRDFMLVEKKKEKSYLIDIINNSLLILEDTFTVNNINVNINIKNSKLSEINSMKNEIMQVILNILNNAKDALLSNKIKNANIDIYLEEDEKTQTIYIQDNANGIADNIINDIFTPYFSTKENKNGTGLGLYISKIIIEKHLHGKINITNVNDGALVQIILIK